MIKKIEEMINLKTVAYLRLSKEDGDDESVSISNQRKILKSYAESNKITIDDWYIDDGYSGYTMTRPSFDKLKTDLRNENNSVAEQIKDLQQIPVDELPARRADKFLAMTRDVEIFQPARDPEDN